MKYRIVHAFPSGYMVQQSRLGLFWGPAIFIKEKPYTCSTVEEAKKDIVRLSISGKPIKQSK